MAVRVRIPSVLRRYSGGAAAADVDGRTVAAALEALFDRHPDLRARVLDRSGRLFAHLVLFRNDEELERATLLEEDVEDGDVLDLVGAAEGG